MWAHWVRATARVAASNVILAGGRTVKSLARWFVGKIVLRPRVCVGGPMMVVSQWSVRCVSPPRTAIAS